MPSSNRIDLVVNHNQQASDAALRIVDSVEVHGYFVWADARVSRTAAYLLCNPPDIAFPENSVQRRTLIYSLPSAF